MYKILIISLLLQITSIATTFEWKSNNNSSAVANPLSEVTQQIEKEINRFVYKKTPLDITKAIPPAIEKPTIPQEIAVPILPDPIKLTRGEFEKTVAFDKRVQVASKTRDVLLTKLQEEYRVKVEARNKEIDRLSLKYNEKVTQRNQIIKNIQAIQTQDNKKLEIHYKAQRELAYTQVDKFAKKAVDKVYGQAKLSYVNYDADSEVIYLLVTSSDGENFKKKVEFNIGPPKAKQLKTDIETIAPAVVFNINMDSDENIKLEINSITLKYDEQLYMAQDVSSEYIDKPIYITIKNKETKFMDVNKSSLALQENYDFQLQNPNLNDKIKIGAVAYTASGAIVGANILLNKAKALPTLKDDTNRWLFMVAVEDYAETDDVIYATRSAEAMKKTMQKRFGISNKNTFAFFNDNASSGALKDNFHSLLAQVKSTDTIYFYYSGHGVPGNDGDAYILPEDKIVDFIDRDTSFKLENIYKELSHSKAKHSFVFIDACFSGKTDNKLIFKGVAPGLIQTKKTLYDENKLTIITAGKDTEFSNMYEEKRYRLFSYYLNKSLLADENNVALLYKKVNLNVLEKSQERGDRYTQTPQIYGNQNVRLY